jgi:hypothetical protein
LATVALVLLVAGGAAGDGTLDYTPPPAPAPADPAGLVLRLVLVTAGALAICGVILWMVRRAQRGSSAAVDPSGRIRHDGSHALDRRSAVHLLRVDGQMVAVTTDGTGLRSMVLLSDSFPTVLEEANSR